MSARESRRRIVAKYLILIVLLMAITLALEFALMGIPVDKTSLLNLLFWDGLIWIGVGALIMGGFADNAMVGRMNPAASPITAEALSRQRVDERDKDLNSGLGMMLVGGLFLLLSLVVFIL